MTVFGKSPMNGKFVVELSEWELGVAMQNFKVNDNYLNSKPEVQTPAAYNSDFDVSILKTSDEVLDAYNSRIISKEMRDKLLQNRLNGVEDTIDSNCSNLMTGNDLFDDDHYEF